MRIALRWAGAVCALALSISCGKDSPSSGAAMRGEGDSDRAIAPAAATGTKRTALVIGNGAYREGGALENPVKDARAVAGALEERGFAVDLALDCTRKEMNERLSAFGRAISGGDAALFYYAGHGYEIDGQNYLKPVDASIKDRADAKVESLGLETVLERMEQGRNRINIVILDACRNNPFPSMLAENRAGAAQGFASIEAPSGTVIAFSTAPHQTADDGAGRPNSPFSAALATRLRESDEELLAFMKSVSAKVASSTSNAQIPWVNFSAYQGAFHFQPPKPIATPTPLPPPNSPPVIVSIAPLQPRQIEGEAFDFQIQAQDLNGDAIAAYICSVNGGQEYRGDHSKLSFRDLAPGECRLRVWAEDSYGAKSEPFDYRFSVEAKSAPIVALLSTPAPVRTQTPASTAAPAPTPFVTPAPPTPSTSSAGADYTETAGGAEIRMIWIPGGTFQMGSPSSEAERDDDEGPVHPVTLDGFWMAQTETTVGQFRRFIESTNYRTTAEVQGSGYADFDGDGNWSDEKGASWRNPGFSQSDDHPVTLVSWDDAAAYCAWLTGQSTDRAYRLPTEAQWEYACRAGTTTARFTGDADSSLSGYANAADASAKRKFSSWTCFAWKDGYIYTSPAGAFQPNAYGLYDMIGNVWEWCSDWYADDYYAASPSKNPTGPSSGSNRVIRGGSWGNDPGDCRSANRYRGTPGYRYGNLGFRVLASSAG